jgi:uncharacterized protein YecE (DUF72 family)
MPVTGRLMVGTSGFAYASWRGSFYPRRLKPAEMLGFYAQRLETVEVNTTFYRTQPDEVVAGWVQAVPPAFRFAVKAHRRITHNRRMPNLEEAVRILALEASGFGDRLGPVLFQFPPTAPFDEGRIERVAALLPSHWRVAYQFRHRSWHTPEIADRLERMGAALVHGDGEAEPGPLGRGAFLYFRLRRDAYSSQRLTAWTRRIVAYLDGGRDVFVYFKHEKLGPLYAQQLSAQVRTSFRPVSQVAL